MTVVKIFTVAALAGAMALSACGRKGPLDTPYEASVNAREEAEEAGEPLPPAREPPVEDRPFILDGLID